MTASLRSGMLITMPLRRPRCLVLRQRFGSRHQHHAGQGRQLLQLLFDPEHLRILRTRREDAGSTTKA